MSECNRCGSSSKVWDDGLCSFCGITAQKRMNVIGLEYATRGRVDVVNPRKDTLRAVEYIANHEAKWSHADIQRWKKQAEALPDVSTKIRDDEWNHDQVNTHPTIQADERHTEGHMRHLWNEAVYERSVLKKKPVNEVQANNYAMVDAWDKAGTG